MLNKYFSLFTDTMESLEETELFKSFREARTFFVELKVPHLVHSTSQMNGGLVEGVRHICNLQSCEGKHHNAIASEPIHLRSEKENYESVCEKNQWDPLKTVFMGTAANMNYAITKVEKWRDLEVHAIATAGVQSNATRAGDPAKYYEDQGKWHPCDPPEGTINIILHINQALTSAAISRAAMTLTEAKTAALLDLGVGSLSSPTLATGTGTDQFCIAAPLKTDKCPITWAGAHTKLGELISSSVYQAVKTAIQWQNGVDEKRCRSLFYQLKRFGFKPEDWESWLKPHVTEEEAPFFMANKLAIEHDLNVSACVSSLCTLLDQERCGIVTTEYKQEYAKQLCALMVTQVASKPENFKATLDAFNNSEDVFYNLAKALVMAWRMKWS